MHVIVHLFYEMCYLLAMWQLPHEGGLCTHHISSLTAPGRWLPEGLQ